MITEVHVSGFKSLSDVKLELGRINVFIGANGSGKSNFLEAIGVASASISGQVDDESLKRRGVRLGLPALYKSSFNGVRTPGHIRFEIQGDFQGQAEYKTNLYNPIESPKRSWTYKNELLSDGSSSTGRSPANQRAYDDRRSWVALKLVEIDPESPRSRLAKCLERYAIYSADTPTLRGVEVDPQNRSPLGLAGGNLPRAIRDITRFGMPYRAELQDFIADNVGWVKSFQSAVSIDLPISDGVPQLKTAVRFTDKYMVKGRNTLSGYDASEGVLYLLFCACLALHDESPQFFAIDNFDQALNPLMAKALAVKFSHWVSLTDKQVLLTTHNPLVLDGLRFHEDGVNLFSVGRDGKGRTSIEKITISEEVFERSRDGMPLSQQWVSGYFGGVPDV